MTRNEKIELIEMSNRFVNMTLNGEIALLYGKKLDYPIVAQVKGRLWTIFSWEAVKRIVESGGDFEL